LNEFILPKFNIDLCPKTMEFVNNWIKKVDLSDKPIDMLDLGWDPYRKNLELFEVIKR
jgi:cytochrome oxidase Cu insertion factor (SCO1/SenC/PrrC family)